MHAITILIGQLNAAERLLIGQLNAAKRLLIGQLNAAKRLLMNAFICAPVTRTDGITLVILDNKKYCYFVFRSLH